MRHFTIIAMAAALAACGEPGTDPQSTSSVATTPQESAVPADMFGGADQTELEAVLVKVASGEAVFPGLPNPPLGICADPDERLCNYEQLKFSRAWLKAYNGDYASQRNVAYALSQGGLGVRSDRMQGCAWRVVIINAADPQVGEGDVSNLELECGALSPAARAAADAQAARIASTIAAR